MRNVAVAGDLVRRVDDYDTFAVFREHARALAQHRRLADARAAQQADRFSATDHVEHDVDRAVHRTADAAGEADDESGAVAENAWVEGGGFFFFARGWAL